MQFEYEYLKGDETAWAIKGAAWNIVSEYCANKHYGTFGSPTDKGRKAMEEYVKQFQIFEASAL